MDNEFPKILYPYAAKGKRSRENPMNGGKETSYWKFLEI
jgi:hypothetical protein